MRELSSKSFDLFSPAKINLFLRVLRKREDGYHELASLFQAINIGDKITFSLSSEDKITFSGIPVAQGPSNLVNKAIALFRNKTGLSDSIAIHVDKKVPLESGLGGGSGNAATVLWGLNILFNFPASLDDLIRWSAEIGSDITFFFSSGTAFCTGRGECFSDIRFPEDSKIYTLAIPNYGLSTKEIFKSLDLESSNEYPSPSELLNKFKLGYPLYLNDLEKPAFQMRPELCNLKTILESTFENVFMTGSGTGLVCIGNRRAPRLEGVQFYPFNFIQRNPSHWYVATKEII